VGLAAASLIEFPRLHISSDPWHPAQPGGGPVRQRWLDANGSLVATGGADKDGWWMHWPYLATYVFGATGDVLAHPEPASHPEHITDSFARGVLPLVLVAREHEALHASAVSADHGVTAFCAPSGTGKSSLALAIACEGGGHWADDTVLVDSEGGRLDAVSLPFPARVDDAARACLAGAAGVEPVPPGSRVPLRRVYLLVRDDAVDPGVPVFAPVPAASRFERLLAHAHAFDLSGQARRRRMIERLMHAAAAMQVCELRFGASLQHLPALAARVRRHMAAH
jgi:hypothetical protein